MKLFLCGDVMLGRGIDQIMQHCSKPKLYEPYVKDARDYVYLAEQRSGHVPRMVHPDYVWGDALQALNFHRPVVKIINLETSITRSNKPWPNKNIHYHMHPKNTNVLTAAKIDVCALANNHVLDWGHAGLYETLAALTDAGIKHCGAGRNIAEAQKPAIFAAQGQSSRVLVFSLGLCSSGILAEWAATSQRPGIWVLENLGRSSIQMIKNVLEDYRQPQDLCIISLHWGGNWVDSIPVAHQDFAHALIDELDIDIVHGHSSHHPMGREIYNNKLILYGCGDLINDYEGIGGHEQYNSQLSLMYFPTIDTEPTRLSKLDLVPMRIRHFKLHYASKNILA